MVEEVVRETPQEIGYAQTPSIKPALKMGSRPLQPEEAAAALKQAILKHLSDPEDLATFDVRRGVTFIAEPYTRHPLLECLLRDHVFLVPVPLVAGVIERGTLDNFAINALERLRDRIFYEPKTYSRLELLFEVLYEMRDLLPEGIPECNDFPDRSSALYRRQIDLIKKQVRERIQPQRVKQAMQVGRRG